ncbi:MAG TPA: TlpA disulfide reductase family protein [Burkholderiales bacterium]|nr:TlpA disulfide reductase family protein [Burkholderiales bacterium]
MKSSTAACPRGFAAFLALFVFLLAACSGGDEGRLRVGQPFPSLRLPGLDGAVRDTGPLPGKVLVLNVWATWCPPCRREMPSLQRLADAAAGRGIVVAGMTVDRDLNLAREFVRETRITFPNYADPEMAVANGTLQVVGFPETFVVGPDGRLAARVVGERNWDAPEMMGALEALARGEPARIR